MRGVNAGDDAQAQAMHQDCCIGHKEGGAVDTENLKSAKTLSALRMVGCIGRVAIKSVHTGLVMMNVAMLGRRRRGRTR